MIELKQYEVWFVTGSQDLYGAKTLAKVAEHSKEIAKALDASKQMAVKVVFKPVLTTPEAIRKLCLEANSSEKCIGLITWMHTFSPAKMWIAGLSLLKKPFAHLHTQYNREIPWAEIDMDFMNLNQAAHGDREFGFIGSRLRLERKVVVGHWQDEDVQRSLGVWARAAAAWADWQGAKVARFGDNMREVAVTEGDKVEAQIKLGYDVYGYGVGDLVQGSERGDGSRDRKNGAGIPGRVRGVGGAQAGRQAAQLAARRSADRSGHAQLPESGQLQGLYDHLRRPARAGAAAGTGSAAADARWLWLRRGRRLEDGGTGAGDESDERGAEGRGRASWKITPITSAPAGDKVLGAHMLEICELIAASKPRLEILPLSIGGKADPVRLIFDANTGPAIWRIDDGYGATLPDGGECGGCGAGRGAAAKAAGGAGAVAASTQFEDRRGGVDLCGRGASYQLQLRSDGGASAGLRRNGRNRIPGDR